MIYFSDRYIIKALEETTEKVYGYDLASETFVVEKKAACRPVSKIALKIFSDERVAYLVAGEFEKQQTKIGTLMGLSARTVHRIVEDLGYGEPERASNLR